MNIQPDARTHAHSKVSKHQSGRSQAEKALIITFGHFKIQKNLTTS
jgi:hypothetical protein